MSENVSGGLWSLVGPVGGSVLGLVGSLLAGFDPKVTAALVAGTAGLAGAVVNGFLASRLQARQAASAKALEDQQRRHDNELAALRSELRGIEDEARQLRAHSLGLKAERRRNFEAKRAEVCEAAFGSLVALMEGIQVVAVEGAELDEAALPAEDLQERLQAKANAAALATAATGRAEVAGLYTSQPLAKRMYSLSLFAWSPITTGSQVSAEKMMFDFRKGLDEVRTRMRSELGYPLADTAATDDDSNDDTAP